MIEMTKMSTTTLDSFIAELGKAIRRPAIWVVIMVGTTLSVAFNYGVSYVTYTNPGSGVSAAAQREMLTTMLPGQMIATVIAGFPVFASAFALVLGVLIMGSEFSWGTFKTILVQRSGRLSVLTGKLLVLSGVVLAFVLAVFVSAAISSYIIATIENASVNWPSIWDVLVAIGGGWLILAVWAAFGAALATLFRGTSLAIGLGLVHLLLVEGVLDVGSQTSNLLADLSAALPRSNASSLAAAVIPSSSEVNEAGVEATVGSTQATLVLIAYLVGFVLVTSLVFYKRDVT